MSHHYDLLTTWCVEAPIGDVFDVLHAAHDYPRWWPGVCRVERLELGVEGGGGVGEVNRMTWRSALPYTLTFDTRVTAVDRPGLLAGEAFGELEGTGAWRLYEGAAGTCAVYRWQVRTTRAWMNALALAARPVFTWNHDHVMREGARGLAGELGVRLVACS